RINISILEGGKKLISVQDDGNGMSYDDALLSIERFATSKIFSISDLKNINTLGFRGEAISSISSVSQFEMITTESGEMLGTRIYIQGGELRDVNEVGGRPGTTINVKNLFFNIPARRKFLRTKTTENIYNLDIITKFALLYSDIAFNYTQEGKEYFNFTSKDSLEERILVLLGKSMSSENMIKIEDKNDFMSIRGFIGKPHLAGTNYGKQYVFVNGRTVRDRVVRRSIDLAYEGYLMRNRYPTGVLDIKIKTDLIDVNIHPQKLEIRFYSPKQVQKFIVNSIKTEMKKQTDLIPTIDLIQTHSTSETNIPENSTVPGEQQSMFPNSNPETLTPLNNEISEDENTSTGKSRGLFAGFRYLGQVFQTYLILESENEMIFIDQHAAAERINFEKFTKYQTSHTFPIQQLLFPLDIELSLAESEFLKENLNIFQNIGIQIEYYGSNTFIITGIPIILDPDFSPTDFKDVFEKIFISKDKSNLPDLSKELIKEMACKGSIRANRILDRAEVFELLRELDAADNPFNCPHGRPTIIRFSEKELEKMFKRIV
ncbi:hypothetical protein KAU33_12070, partial [Candidatus Dependentiae bacterium]|nr:hypothetical protein [Candidatus Dependentiae bacterium]